MSVGSGQCKQTLVITGYIGDEILPTYGIILSHDKDPH